MPTSMAIIMSFIRWIERLSLDAVLVAVAWGWGLTRLAGIKEDPVNLCILAAATWLTYVADRLRDCRPGTAAPGSDRHRYYKNHYKAFIAAWIAVFIPCVAVAFIHLPLWKWAGGWSIIGLIILYLWMLGHVARPVGRMLLKRIAVPLIFSVGVAWMAESWRTGEGVYATLALLAGCLLNLLLISSHENRDNPELTWLPKAFLACLLIIGLSGPVAIAFHPPTSMAILCFTIPYLLAYPAIQRYPRFPVRTFADGILLIAAIPLVFK